MSERSLNESDFKIKITLLLLELVIPLPRIQDLETNIIEVKPHHIA